MPTGPRPPARPGAGPGRARDRFRIGGRDPAGGPPKDDAAAARAGSTAVVTTPATRTRNSLTTRAIALVVVLLVLVISYASSLRIYFAQTHEIAATRTEIVERQQRIDDLQGQLGQWNDADYVRTQARERLGWVVPGETGYQVVGPDGQPLGGGAEIEGATPSAEAPQDAWWSRLWGSVEAADQPAPAKPEEKTITPKTKPQDAQR